MSTINLHNRRILHQHATIKTVVFYAIFAFLWIYFSDTLLQLFISDPEVMTRVQTIKGSLFVLVTAGLLYIYLGHSFRLLRHQEEMLSGEQDKAREEIQERFRQLNTLFDSMNALVYVADCETYELLYANQFAVDYFGPDWHGRKCFNYLQEGMLQPCDFCTNPQLIVDGKPGKPVVWEFHNTRNKRWYECFDKAIYWTDGRLVRLEVALDITERKELENIKDDLLSTMSHEMRTPLTAVSGFAELLLNEPELQERHKRHVEIIYREAGKLADLINNFLDVRRLKVNRARVNYEPLELLNLIEQARKNCRDCKEQHHIQIDCPPDTQAFGNRKEITQVITQLLENACRYSPQGGKISINASSDGDQTLIRVTDEGIGIPHHEIGAIFEPFYRLDTGDTRKTGGIGLGLCVAKEIITLHGGRIEVDSTPGQGSTFSVTLPRPSESSTVSSQGSGPQ